jgi:hypothetical protein
VVHGATVLSDVQTKLVCGAVSVYAGTQVYIKWSHGPKAEQFARQFSKIMDCAGVTVTYASEAAGLEGRGVRVGFHANEGETSDRLRPFADALTAALQEQGFTVAEVSGPDIPTDQTAVFIGPE